MLDVTCKTVANMIKGKTPEEIRKTFNIKNDFTEEEEAQVKQALVSCLSPVLHAVMRFTHQNVVCCRYARRTSGVKRSEDPDTL